MEQLVLMNKMAFSGTFLQKTICQCIKAKTMVILETIAMICLNLLETTHNSKSNNELFVGWENRRIKKILSHWLVLLKTGCILFSILIFCVIHEWKTCIVRFVFCYHFQFQYIRNVRIKTKLENNFLAFLFVVK